MSKTGKSRVFFALFLVFGFLTVSAPLVSSNGGFLSVQYSSDWSTPVNLNVTDLGSILGFFGPTADTCIATDSQGNVHVAFAGESDNAAGSLEIYYVTNKGGSWSWANVTQTNLTGNAAFTPVIAVDSNDVVHIVFLMVTQPGSLTFNMLYTNNSGGSWHPWMNITSHDNSSTEAFPSMVIDSNNVIHLAYYSANITLNKGWLMYRTYTASTGWSTAVNLTDYIGTFEHIQSYPSIALDSSRNVYIAYAGYNTSNANHQELYLISKTAGGWGSPFNVSANNATDPVFDGYPTMDIDVYNNLHIAWITKNGSAYGGVKYRSYSIPGNSWGGIQYVNATAGYAYRVSLKADLGGRVHIVYDQENATTSPKNYEIYYVNNVAGSFSTPVNITGSDDMDEQLPYIAIDNTGYIHLVFNMIPVGAPYVVYSKSVNPLAAFTDYTPVIIIGAVAAAAVIIAAGWYFIKIRKPET